MRACIYNLGISGESPICFPLISYVAHISRTLCSCLISVTVHSALCPYPHVMACIGITYKHSTQQ